MPSYVLFPGYLVLALAPLVLAWAMDMPPRPFWDELSTAIALMAFAMLLMEFVLSGRLRAISGRTGIDATMRFHQLMARGITLLFLAHPFLYTLPIGPPLPWDTSRQSTLGLTGWPIASGLAAWILLAVVVITGIFRDQLPFRYEAWRISHGLGAALIALFGAHHAIEAGRYSGQPALTALWIAMLALALAMIVLVYAIRPLLQLRHPYRVVVNRPIAVNIRELVLAPARGRALTFEAGQFVWLTLDRSPFAIREHPFSIASSPDKRDRLAFIIKGIGDFTSRLGEVAMGAPAYLDGPHGGLALTGRRGTGIVFIAGGVGIAPILSMLRHLAATRDPRPMILMYGNRVPEQIVYADELNTLRGELDLQIIHVLSEPPQGWTGEVGLIDADLLSSHCPREGREGWHYVVCGPTPMIESVEDALMARGVPARRILSEKFSYF